LYAKRRMQRKELGGCYADCWYAEHRMKRKELGGWHADGLHAC
jgi:hypothetical protein